MHLSPPVFVACIRAPECVCRDGPWFQRVVWCAAGSIKAGVGWCVWLQKWLQNCDSDSHCGIGGRGSGNGHKQEPLLAKVQQGISSLLMHGLLAWFS